MLSVALAAKKTTAMSTSVNVVNNVLFGCFSVSSIDWFFGRFTTGFVSMHVICTSLGYKTDNS